MPYIWIKKLSKKQKEKERIIGELINKIHDDIKSTPKISEIQGPQFLDPKIVEKQFGESKPISVVSSSDVKETFKDYKIQVVNLKTGEIKDASEKERK